MSVENELEQLRRDVKHPAFTAQGYSKGIQDERDISYQRPLSLDNTPERW